jgi:hypothetical protein
MKESPMLVVELAVMLVLGLASLGVMAAFVLACERV